MPATDDATFRSRYAEGKHPLHGKHLRRRDAVIARLSKGQSLFLLAALALPCAELLICWRFSSDTNQISSVSWFCASGFALAACLWRFRRTSRGVSFKWLVVASGIFLWFVGICVTMVGYFLGTAVIPVATASDFFFFCYGIPMLIAASMPEKNDPLPVFILLEVLQAVAAGYLAYVALFNAVPFSGSPQRPIGYAWLIPAYDAENILLALLVTTRLVFSVRDPENRRFFKILAAYFWSYALFVGLFNHFAAGASDFALWLLAFPNLPFFVLATGAIFAGKPQAEIPLQRHSRQSSLIVENARPILLGLSLVALSTAIARNHFDLALGFFFGAFVLYGIRSTLLQSHLQRSQIELEEARDRLEQLAMQDGLTGIANRRRFDMRLEHEWSRAHRSRRPLALLIADIDNFKPVNDNHGHLIGDECLKQTAAALASVLHRPGDLIARYGGEEFAILLAETDLAGALLVAEHMMEAVANSSSAGPRTAIPLASPLTISIGITACESFDGFTPGQLIETADKALYLAKQNGRNRIESLAMPIPPASRI